MPRSNLLAYDITTGALELRAHGQRRGQVRRRVSRRQALYVGGSFTGATGRPASTSPRSTPPRAPSSRPSTPRSAAHRQRHRGHQLHRLLRRTHQRRPQRDAQEPGGGLRIERRDARLGADDDLQVDTMVIEPGGAQLIIGGRFDQVNDAPQRGLAALDLTTGDAAVGVATVSERRRRAPTRARPASARSPPTPPRLRHRLGVGEQGRQPRGHVRRRGRHRRHPLGRGLPRRPLRHLLRRRHVYSTSHEHDCDTVGAARTAPATCEHEARDRIPRRPRAPLTRSQSVSNIYADWSGTPAPAEYNWYPDWLTGTASRPGRPAGRSSATATSSSSAVSSRRQQQAQPGHRPIRQDAGQRPAVRAAPQRANWTPSAKSVRQGAILVSIPANWDRDGQNLTYEFRRAGQTLPFATDREVPVLGHPERVTHRPGVTAAQSHLPGRRHRRGRITDSA